MHKKKLFVLFISFILVFTLSITGCKTKKASPGGTLNFRLIYDPLSLDPAHGGDLDSIQVISQVFDSLVDYDPKTAEVIPAVAEKWETNDAADEFTFYLKKGVKFHNGQEVKADDFKYAWERIVDPKTASEMSYHFLSIEGYDELSEGKVKELKGVEVVDDYTLKVKLSNPNADFVSVVGHAAFSPVPKEEVEKDEKAFADKPVGNGPFKVKKWDKGEKVETVKYDDYYGEEANINKVDYLPIEDDNTALNELKADNIDLTYIPVGQLDTLKNNKEYNVDISPLIQTYFFAFNLTEKPCDNKKVRQAFNYAINRQDIVEKYAENAAEIATSIVPKGMPGYKKEVTNYSYNPEKAKKLLAESGYPGGNGFPKETLIYEEGLGHDIVAQIVQQNLKEIGINIQIQGLEGATHDQWIEDGKAGMFRIGWVADYPLMDNFLTPLFAEEGNANLSGYTNESFEKKLEEAKEVKDKETRTKLYQEAEEMLMEDAPIIPILYQTNRYVVNKKVKDLEFSPLGLVDTTKVWIEK